MLKRGGIFVLISTYSWDNNVTPKQNWIGGKDKESIE